MKQIDRLNSEIIKIDVDEESYYEKEIIVLLFVLNESYGVLKVWEKGTEVENNNIHNLLCKNRWVLNESICEGLDRISPLGANGFCLTRMVYQHEIEKDKMIFKQPLKFIFIENQEEVQFKSYEDVDKMF